MQNIATSFWRFAFFHGVTGSAKKTVYASTDPAAGVVSMMSFSRLSTPGNPKRHAAILSPVVSGKAIRYLGGPTLHALQMEECCRRYGSGFADGCWQACEAQNCPGRCTAVLFSSYYGQGGLFSPTMSPHDYPDTEMGQPTETGSYRQSCYGSLNLQCPHLLVSTGWPWGHPPFGAGGCRRSYRAYKRLISPGLLGEAARSRWTAFQRILDKPGDVALLSAKQLALHHTGHILRLAWRFAICC